MTTHEQYEEWFIKTFDSRPFPSSAPAFDFCWAGYQAGAASRDAEVAFQKQAHEQAQSLLLEQGAELATALAERDQLRDEIAELVAALKPFGAIDLVESRLPAEFAMLILRARAAIAKARKL